MNDHVILSHIFETEQMRVAIILNLSSPIYLLKHKFSINYENNKICKNNKQE